MKGQFPAISFGLALAAFSISNASAEEKCKMNTSVAAANNTYTQQHVIDVGDVPGHQVRIFELHRTYPADTKPNCEGLRAKEAWLRGFTDYTDRNGPARGYGTVTLENGDKMFFEFSSITQTGVTPDGAKKSTVVGVGNYTGGTGKYQSLRGIIRYSDTIDPEKNYNEDQSEAEYWLSK